jgi:hypothetical protein
VYTAHARTPSGTTAVRARLGGMTRIVTLVSNDVHVTRSYTHTYTHGLTHTRAHTYTHTQKNRHTHTYTVTHNESKYNLHRIMFSI